MRSEQTKQTLKLHLLAFVLALALFLYVINPSPRPVTMVNREDELPDEKKREAEPEFLRSAILPMVCGTPGAAFGYTPAPIEDEDDFDWPEFIDC